jgi:hypothetical protein
LAASDLLGTETMALASFVKVIEYAAGTGTILLIGYFGSSQMQVINDVTGLKHDIVHGQEADKAIAGDVAEIRHVIVSISKDLGIISGAEQVQSTQIGDVKKTLDILIDQRGRLRPR